MPARRTGPFPRSAADEQVRADSRARRLALYDEVQRRRAAGEPLISIARAMKLARGTVRSYAHASSFPERAARRPGHSTIDRHLPHLQARVQEAPNYCHGCGAAYRWRQTAIANAIEVLQMDLEGQDAADAADLVRAVAVETPRTEIAALKLKRLLPKLGKATYDVAIKVISDVASETAKKTLGLKPRWRSRPTAA